MGCFGAEGNTNKAEFLEWPLLPPHHSNAAHSSPGFIKTLPVLFLVNQGFDRKKNTDVLLLSKSMMACLRSPPPRYMISCWCCVDSLTTCGEKSHCEVEGGSARVHLLCQPWKTAVWVPVLASSCGAGEASERPAASENCGAENCCRVLIVTTQTFSLFLNLLVCMSHFKLVMMWEARLLDPRLTDWAALPWLIEYIICTKI